MSVIGVDLGGTKLAAAVFDSHGGLLKEEIVQLGTRQAAQVGTLIASCIDSLRTFDNDIEAIGISVPGISNTKTGNVWAPNIPGWDNYPLCGELQSHLGDERIPIVIEADRSCYIMGEVWRGSAQGCKNAIFLAVGTGIGAGILINGNILHGSNDISGAIGWLALDRPYHDKYKSCGCFEYYASGDGIARFARDLLSERQDYHGTLRSRDPSTISAHDIFDLYPAGDPIARETLDRAIELWGMTTANLVSLFNPEKIIFGGGIFGPASQFLGRIMTEARKWAQPISINQVSLEISALGGSAGLYGAGYFALIAGESQ
jgi:glucokinase